MKKFLTLILTFMIAASLCACGQKGSGPSPEASGQSTSAPNTEAGGSGSETGEDAASQQKQAGTVTVEITPPEGWTKNEDSVLPVHYMKGTASFMVKAEPFSGTTLDDVVKEALEIYKKSFDITLSVPVTSGDSSTVVATKVNAALAQNSDITDFFTISPDNGRYVRLTAKVAADNDPTLNISISNDNCTGLTAIPTSTVDAAGNVGTKQVETLTVSGSVSYNWTYNLYYQSFPTRDGQSFGSTFFLGKTVPGLKFTTPPAAGASITASFALEYPFKTANNLLRFTYSVQLQRG